MSIKVMSLKCPEIKIYYREHARKNYHLDSLLCILWTGSAALVVVAVILIGSLSFPMWETSRLLGDGLGIFRA